MLRIKHFNFRWTIESKMFLFLVVICLLGNACDKESLGPNSTTPARTLVLGEPPADSYFYKICTEINSQPADVISSLRPLLNSLPNKTCKGFYWHLNQTKSLKINSPEFSALEIISEFDHLDWLDISFTSITSLKPLINFSELTSLRIRECPKLIDLEALNNFPSLQVLNLYGTQITNLDFVKDNLISLRFLNLGDTSIKDLSGIAKFPNLERLLALKNTADFTPIKNLLKLTYLDISHTNFDSTEIINDLPNLRHLIATKSNITKTFKKAGLHVVF